LGLFLIFYYAWIMDDAYVYFRYIDNMELLGIGLVYNRGEYVEGFSSPAWAFILAVLRSVGLGYWVIIRGVAVAAFVTFWAALVIINRKLSGTEAGTYIVNFPLINLSLTYGVLCYFTSGLETPLVQVCGVLYACFLLFPGVRLLQFVVGISPFIRHELAIPCLMALAWFVVSRRRIPWTLVITGMVFGILLFVFRIYYYADLLPNTFYLKNETAVARGLLYLKDTVLPYSVHYILPFLALCLAVLKITGRRETGYHMAERAMMVLIGLSFIVYVVKIGGDPRHYRFLAFPYCIIMASTGGIVEALMLRLGLRSSRMAVLALSLILALFTVTRYPRQLDKHPLLPDVHHRPVDEINDAALHRSFRAFSPSPWTLGSEIELGGAVEEFLERHPPNQYVDVIWCPNCYFAYTAFPCQVINGLGLTDPFLARTEMRSERAAHKFGLMPLAEDMVRIRKKYGFRKGAFRTATENGDAPAWVEENLTTIERIEQKVYNEHAFFENLRIAFMRTGRIRLAYTSLDEREK